MARQLGVITQRVIDLLNLNIEAGTPILLGETNIRHMLNNHYQDYIQYNAYLTSIINNPDYIALNPRNNSIEYVKEIVIQSEYVKVAVRVSNSGKYFARTLYRLNNNRVRNYINNGTLIPY